MGKRILSLSKIRIIVPCFANLVPAKMPAELCKFLDSLTYRIASEIANMTIVRSKDTTRNQFPTLNDGRSRGTQMRREDGRKKGAIIQLASNSSSNKMGECVNIETYCCQLA